MRPIAAAPLVLAMPALATPQGASEGDFTFSDLLHDADGSAIPEADVPADLALGVTPRPEGQAAAPSFLRALPSALLPTQAAVPDIDGVALSVDEVDDSVDAWFDGELDAEPALAEAELAPVSIEEDDATASEAALGGALPWLALLPPAPPLAPRAPKGAVAQGPTPQANAAPQTSEGVRPQWVAAAAIPLSRPEPVRPEPVAAPAAEADPLVAPDLRAAAAPLRSAPEPSPSVAAHRPPLAPPPASPSRADSAALEPAGLAIRAESAAPQAAASRADGPNWSWAVVTQAIRTKMAPGPASPPLAAARASRTWDSTPWFPQGAPPAELAPPTGLAPPPVDAQVDPAALAESAPELSFLPSATPPAAAAATSASSVVASASPPAPDQAELLDSMLPARISDELEVVVREAEGILRVHMSAHNQGMSVHLRAPEALVGGLQALAPEVDAALGEAGYSLDSFEAETDGGDPQPDREGEPEPRGAARRPAEESAAGRDSSIHRVV